MQGKGCGASDFHDTVAMKEVLTSVKAANMTTPRGFFCPLTLEVMCDPVLDMEGHTYERSAILEWLKDHHTSPMSRQLLSETMLRPNIALREVIHEFMGDEWVKQRASELRMTHSMSHARYDQSIRAKMNCFLHLASLEIPGLPSVLNEKGCCAFHRAGIAIIIDVPTSQGIFCLYTCSLVQELTESMKDLLLELNYLQGKLTS